MGKTAFRVGLEKLINCDSMENGSDTPDFILAEYLTDCLDVFDRTIRAREKWYGRDKEPVPSHEAPPAPPHTPEEDRFYAGWKKHFKKMRAKADKATARAAGS